MGKRHVFEPREYYFAYGPHDPALTVKPGDRLVTTTVDASCCDGEGRKLRRSEKHVGQEHAHRLAADRGPVAHHGGSQHAAAD